MYFVFLRFCRLKIEALSSTSNWVELEKFSRTKKLAVGFEVMFQSISVVTFK